MPSVTVTKIDKRADGRVFVHFGKDVREYGSIQHMRQCVRGAIDRSDLIDLALALILSRQPSLGNPSALEGRTLAVDFSAANWGTVS